MTGWAPVRLVWIAAVFLVGCTPIAHINWSPDGAQAAYFVPTAGKLLPGVAYLLDTSGKTNARLGPTFGSFAWSADSKTVYFGAYDNSPAADQVADRSWLVDPKQATPTPASDSGEGEYPPMVLSAWHDGAAERLVSMGNRYVIFLHLSPDQKWLAVTTAARDKGDQWRFELFVCNIATKSLHVVSENCGMGACFTGPSHLAYAQADGVKTSGSIVEAELNDSADHLDRIALVDVLWDRTSCLFAVEDGLLLTTAGRVFPAASSKSTAGSPPNLYHYSRADGKLTTIAESTGELFAVSPDGKRILYIKDTPGAEEHLEKRELAVINSDGSNGHILLDISRYGAQPSMWPAWHGNDRITFVPGDGKDLPGKPDDDPKIAFDLVDYRITAENLLEPAATLSGDWPAEMKPAMRRADFEKPIPPPP